MTKEFKNQYDGLPKEAVSRTTFSVSRKDVAFLLSFDPKLGNLQTTLSLLLTKCIHELRQSNIAPGDYSSYNTAVAGLTVRLPDGFYPGTHTERSPAGVPPAGDVPHGTTKTSRGNERRRAKGMA